MRIITLLLMLGAGAGLWFYGMPLLQEGQPGAQAAESGGLLIPGFADSINDVQAVQVEDGSGSTTLERSEDGSWGMAEKAGFPADGEKVKKLLVELLEAEILEQKTSNPELYGRLGVEDPAEGNEAKRVVLKGAEGAELVSLIVGKAREGARSGSESYYVRRSDEAASLQVQANLQVPAQQSEWLDRDLLDLGSDRIQAVEVQHADGERIYALKPDDSATDMELEEIPDGKELRYASVANSLASGLQRLTMDDVAGEDVEFDNPPQATTTFWTFDGLRVQVQTQEADEKLYARITASYDEAGAPGAVQEMGPEIPADLPAEGEEDTEGEEAPAEPAGPTPEEVQAEATEIGSRLGSWTFVLPSWKKSTFQKRQDDLFKDIVVEEPAQGAIPIDGAGDGAPSLLFEGDDPPALEEEPEQPVFEDLPGDDPPADPNEEPVIQDLPADVPPATDPPSEDPPATDPPADDPPATDPPVDPPAGGGGGQA